MTKKHVTIIIVWIFFSLLLTNKIEAKFLTYYQQVTHSELTFLDERIWFSTGDTLEGPVRSNDYISIRNSPRFHDRIITSQSEFRYQEPDPFFANEPVFNAPLIYFPTEFTWGRYNSYPYISDDGGRNMTWIRLRGERGIDIFQYELGEEPEENLLVHIDMPTELGVIFVEGQVEIEGVVTGNLTIGSSGNMWLVDDIIYDGADRETGQFDEAEMWHMLGLVSESNIIIKDNLVNGARDGFNVNRNDMDRHSIVLNGSLIALQGSFTFEHHNDDEEDYQGPTPDERGIVHHKSSIAQFQRGYMSRSNHELTGYGKDFHFDSRLKYRGPPGFNAYETGIYEGWFDYVETNFGTFRNANIGTLVITPGRFSAIVLDGENALIIRDKLIIRGSPEDKFPVEIQTKSGRSALRVTGSDSTLIQNVVFNQGVELVVYSRSVIIENTSFSENIFINGNIEIARSRFAGKVELTSFNTLSVLNSQFENTLTIRGKARNGEIVNNTFVFSPTSAIELNGYESIKLVNNIIAFNNFGIKNNPKLLQPDLKYNAFYANRDGDHDGCEPDIGYFNLNSKFQNVRVGDYSLNKRSPCINSGDPESPDDPDGSRADRGAIYHHLNVAETTFDLITPRNSSGVDRGWVTFGWEYFQDDYQYQLNVSVEDNSVAFTTPYTKYSLDLSTLDVLRLDTEIITWWIVAFSPEDTVESSDRFDLLIVPNSADNRLGGVPDKFGLLDIYPNPVNSSTRITFGVDRNMLTTLSIFNQSGRQVKELFSGVALRGYHNITWSAAHMPTGVYMLKIQSEGNIQTKNIVLIR